MCTSSLYNACACSIMERICCSSCCFVSSGGWVEGGDGGGLLESSGVSDGLRESGVCVRG